MRRTDTAVNVNTQQSATVRNIRDATEQSQGARRQAAFPNRAATRRGAVVYLSSCLGTAAVFIRAGARRPLDVLGREPHRPVVIPLVPRVAQAGVTATISGRLARMT